MTKKFKIGDRVRTIDKYSKNVRKKRISGRVIDEYKSKQMKTEELHLVTLISDSNVNHTLNVAWLEKDLTLNT